MIERGVTGIEFRILGRSPEYVGDTFGDEALRPADEALPLHELLDGVASRA